MKCTFFGHRDIKNQIHIKKKLSEVLKDLIENKGIRTFYVGNNGSFDSLVQLTLKELKKISGY
ncbi:MAG: hypothetical protein IKU52_02355 [Clostridia bacterium]|nr:hypothetical protein [Clostridia bacterium]